MTTDNKKGTTEGTTLQRIAVVVGTRPEVIKMAPVIHALRERPDAYESVVISTGQHRKIVDQAFQSFGLTADMDLQLMTQNQSLAGFSARALAALDDAFEKVDPTMVLVQGDTLTVHAAALAARYRQLDVGHVEAGLRSFDDLRPFPEEINRRATAALTTHHFAPTAGARANLLREGIDESRIFVTGNTVVDALESITLHDSFEEPELRSIDFERGPVALLTAHRRESHGHGMEDICHAVRDLANLYPTLRFVYPVHPNPNVRETVFKILDDIERVYLVPPVGYCDMLRLLDRCHFALSDSGGIQEEAPSFDIPLLILRDVTERPEVVQAGAATLVGSDRQRIISAASALLDDEDLYSRMAAARNPFGDGHAADRIARILAGQSWEAFHGSLAFENPFAGAVQAG